MMTELEQAPLLEIPRRRAPHMPRTLGEPSVEREDNGVRFSRLPGLGGVFVQRMVGAYLPDILASEVGFCVIHAGVYNLQVRGERYALTPGVYVFSAGEFMRGEKDRRRTAEATVVWVDPKWFGPEAPDASPLSSMAFQPLRLDDPALVEAVHGVLRCAESGARSAAEAALQTLVGLASTRIAPPLDPNNRCRSAAMETARLCLENKSNENVRLDFLAAEVGLSKSHLVRTFKHCYGTSPHQYQVHCRVRLARRLLMQSKTLAAVALECGFADQSHFTRLFKRIVGVTPGEYRAALN